MKILDENYKILEESEEIKYDDKKNTNEIFSNSDKKFYIIAYPKHEKKSKNLELGHDIEETLMKVTDAKTKLKHKKTGFPID